MAEEKKESFFNPIDKDKIAENPHTLPYAHTVGGVPIKPVDKGKVKGQAVAAMYEQTDMQLLQIKRQIDLLAEQAKNIQRRIEVSENIYLAEMNFKPLMGHVYHLYQRPAGSFVLSMIGPDEWGKTRPFQYLATVKLLSDHTWDILEEA